MNFVGFFVSDRRLKNPYADNINMGMRINKDRVNEPFDQDNDADSGETKSNNKRNHLHLSLFLNK